MSTGELQYSINLGVNEHDGRDCAGEAGPFRTYGEAYRAGHRVMGMLPCQLAGMLDTYCPWRDDGQSQALPIVGFTIEQYTDDEGTVQSWDFEGGVTIGAATLALV